jgi:hypothetical protein
MAIVLAGLLAVIAANSVWIALFRLEAYILFNPWEGWFDVDLWPYTVSYRTEYTEGFIGFAVVIWLIGCVVRRASKSIAAGRS